MAGTVITKKGLQLIAKLVASGTALTFTRVSVGTGSVPAGYDPGSMTDLNNYKMDGSISSCSFLGDEASIIMQISSLGVEVGFTITETGLFATDPDEGEILYSYLDLSKDPQYVYEENSAISKFVEMTLVVKVGTVERVTAQLNPRSLLTRDGDISDTSINELEPIDTKYPVPAAGETAKVFMGKVKKYIEDTKPLDADMTVYVSTTGSDTTGDGTSENPYKTITYALSTVPKNLGDHTVTINIADGTYAEDVTASGFYAGSIRIRSNVENSFNTNCVVQSLTVWTCSANITLQGLTVVEQTNKDAIYIVNTRMVNVNYVRCLKENPTTSCVMCVGSYVSINNCELLNHLRAVYATEGGSVFINGSKATGNIVGLAGSIISNQNSNMPGNIVVNPGGIQVSSYGAKIGTLVNDVALYVATTGSDITGDGTSENPFRTIKRAIDAAPKDLSGYACTINIASGTYNEDVHVYGFHNGSINLFSATAGTLSTSCNVSSIQITQCVGFVRLNGFNLTSTTRTPILVGATNGAYIYYCQSTVPTPSIDGIQCYESKVSIEVSKMTGKQNAVMASFSTVRSADWYTSSGNAYGIYSVNGSRVIMNGTQPSGTNTNFPVGNGGMFVNNNGTQISGIISSGLSCTWGTISGGYIRHGNLNGVAMITVQMGIVCNTVLSAGTYYTISGFPIPATPLGVAVTCHTDVKSVCLIQENSNLLRFQALRDVPVGYVILLSCTYLANQ